jgi:aminoglycoside phosphotransferase (APT) family kinase protein
MVRSDDPAPVVPAGEFRGPADMVPLDTGRLGPYLAEHGLGLDSCVPVRQFASGLANINYLVRAGGRWLVLRRPPPGELPPGAHDMAREHRILSRLGSAMPLAPRSVHLCEDRSVLGVPFQLVEHRPGIVIKGDDRTRFDGRPELARQTGDMLVATLAAIHRVDVAAVGLGDLGRPEGFVRRAIAGWRQRAERVAPAPRLNALAGEIATWLERQTTAARAPVLLHCDFKLDNMILDPATLAPVAVVDWEMGTRGDPLFDLATMLSYWTEAGDPECLERLRQMPTAAPGFLSRAETVAAYARISGADVSDYQVFRVLALEKLAVVFLQLNALFLSGARTDADYATFGTLGEDLMLYARDVIEGRAA